ncbi:MAG: kelch repeat-containing protein [Deltaproteobacteria bacterium]
MRRVFVFFGLLLGTACSAEGPQIEVIFDWAGARPNVSELFARARVESTDRRTLSESTILPYAPDASLELPSIPIGTDRIIRIELTAEPDPTTRALFYGISEPFDLAADVDVAPSVRVAMRPAPRIDCSGGFGGITVRGAARNVVGDEDVELMVATDYGSSVRVSEGGPPSPATPRIELVAPVDSPSTASFPMFAVPWTLASCNTGEVCQRRVFVEALDEEGYASAVCRAEIDLDQEGPTLVDETFSLTITPPPNSLLREVDRATVGANVRVSVGLSEPLADIDPQLEAVSSSVLGFTFLQRQGTQVVFELDVKGTHADGVYALELVSTDRFGNASAHQLPLTLTIDKRPPPPAVNDPGDPHSTGGPVWAPGAARTRSMTVHVSPAGSAATNGRPSLTIQAQPRTFDGATAIAVRAPGTNQILGIAAVRPDGGLEETDLVPLDVATVQVLTIDAAGNVGAPRIVRDVIRTVHVVESADDAEVEVRRAPQTRTSAWQQLDRLGTPITARDRAALSGRDGSIVSVDAEPRWRETRRSKRSPADRSNPGLAYDAIRGRTVLFGGHDGVVNLSRTPTWEWVADEWRDVSPATEVPARWGHRLVYDRKRGRTVLFAGIDPRAIRGDLWEWDGSDWVENVEAGEMSVLRRYHHAMAYDSTHGRTLMCGGWLPRYPPGVTVIHEDCWYWDGYAWTPGPDMPGRRWLHDMVYDPVAQRFVVHGGRLGEAQNYAYIGSVLYGDGARWTKATTTAKPDMSNHRIFWDPVTTSVFAYGLVPFKYDFWRWDPVSAGLEPVPSGGVRPPERLDHAMAYDEDAGAALLFGGTSSYPDFEQHRDTWGFKDGAWIDMTPSQRGPSTRSGHALAYDARRGVTVLFGGIDRAGTLRADVWSWNGFQWSCEAGDALSLPSDGCASVPSPAPTPRIAMASAYLATSNQVVIHGGCEIGSNRGECDPTAPRLDETWMWDGNTWSQAEGPPARADAAMTAVGPGQLLLFGGCDQTTSNEMFASCEPLDDTWTFDGATWTRVAATLPPSPRARPSLTYHEGVGAVLFGGCDAVSNPQGGLNRRDCRPGTFVLADTNAMSWIEVATSTTPDGRSGAAFVYDEVRRHSVLFGGEDPTNGRHRDTWFFDGVDWSHRKTSTSATPPGNNGRRAVFDRGRQRIVLYGDADAYDLSSGVWEYDYGRSERPAWVIALKWNQVLAELSDVQSVEISAVANGVGASDALVAEAGARLEAWDAVRGAWELIEQHDQPGLDTLQLDATDPTAANRWFVERDAQLYLRVTPRGYDLGPTPAQVSLDYVEATVRYTLPDR